MVNEQSSDIVMETRRVRLDNDEPVQLLVFRNQRTLALARGSLAFYKAPEYFGDPLGNGLISATDLAAEARLEDADGAFVESIQAGCVTLRDGKILLILPNDVRLHATREEALHNRNALAQLSLADT